MFFQKWCLSLLLIVIIKQQVRVLRLMKLHDYLNVRPCIICTPSIIWFRHGTSGIFGLWAFRKYIHLCVSNVHDKEYAPLKQNICIFLYFGVKHFFRPICDLWPSSFRQGSYSDCQQTFWPRRRLLRPVWTHMEHQAIKHQVPVLVHKSNWERLSRFFLIIVSSVTDGSVLLDQ